MLTLRMGARRRVTPGRLLAYTYCALTMVVLSGCMSKSAKPTDTATAGVQSLQELLPADPLALTVPGSSRNGAASTHLAWLSSQGYRQTGRRYFKPSTAVPAVRVRDIGGVHELPSSYWAVQLAAVRNIENVARMVQQHGLTGTGLLGVPVRTGAGDMHAVLLGVYRTRQQALDGATRVPAPFAALTPWVRPLGQLQAAMR